MRRCRFERRSDVDTDERRSAAEDGLLFSPERSTAALACGGFALPAFLAVWPVRCRFCGEAAAMLDVYSMLGRCDE